MKDSNRNNPVTIDHSTQRVEGGAGESSNNMMVGIIVLIGIGVMGYFLIPILLQVFGVIVLGIMVLFHCWTLSKTKQPVYTDEELQNPIALDVIYQKIQDNATSKQKMNEKELESAFHIICLMIYGIVFLNILSMIVIAIYATGESHQTFPINYLGFLAMISSVVIFYRSLVVAYWLLLIKERPLYQITKPWFILGKLLSCIMIAYIIGLMLIEFGILK